MNDKEGILTTLREEFNHWEETLAGLSEEQLTTPLRPSKLSIKDTVVHLWAWQLRSVARLEAALQNHDPKFPRWPAQLKPDSEEDVDQVNAWIYETYRARPWSSVHRDWQDNFLRFLELAEAIPEEDLLPAGKYPWLQGYPLSLVLTASYEHHHDDHLEPLLDWLRQQGNVKSME